ncbi:MAG: phage tail protein [Burkholderiales bacterium]|uniref:phage tail protein n=1 Tax=Nitrosomonas sp. TaxID=42353 RepID=UPI001E0C68E1|nr:tail fiber protein [Nitrosomonas sp.]MCB1950233.1 phage tail protein [Nitrosomonas sp.]MCP5243932.1 phage tail protein [Burkholderiales bacterium]
MICLIRRFALLFAISFSLIFSLLVSNKAQACSSDPMLGSMCVFAGNFAPRGWALANGQLLSISENQALFSILGTTYGGDGRTTFALPDTKGRAIIGAGHGTGLSNYALGARGGAETVTLTQPQLPVITPTATVHAQSGNVSTGSPGNNVWATDSRQNFYSNAAPDVSMNPGAVTINSFGGGESHENRPPYIAMNWIIALQGIYPSRN